MAAKYFRDKFFNMVASCLQEEFIKMALRCLWGEFSKMAASLLWEESLKMASKCLRNKFPEDGHKETSKPTLVVFVGERNIKRKISFVIDLKGSDIDALGLGLISQWSTGQVQTTWAATKVHPWINIEHQWSCITNLPSAPEGHTIGLGGEHGTSTTFSRFTIRSRPTHITCCCPPTGNHPIGHTFGHSLSWSQGRHQYDGHQRS